MTKYLYGAAVQGIQGFIFKTNELKEITRKSELVERICTDMFENVAEGKGDKVIGAAGNVKYIFTDREDCERVVREFPRMVMTAARGITVSQAVVEYDEVDESQDKFGDAVNKLEEKLRAQRNRAATTMTYGLLGMDRDAKTGLPIILNKDEGKQDLKKLSKKSFGRDVVKENVYYDIDKMTKSNDWIAVIHADGNGMGTVVREIGRQKDKFKEFSEQLDKATEKAANDAYNAVKDNFDEKGIIPIRPVVLGGDDMTVIIRGDLAIDYVKTYIEKFEEYTLEKTGYKLTACAGIAFVKSSYPFYYAYNLAEQLCSKAKEKCNREASCLMFHKVQDSFITKYDDIVKRELTPKGGPSLQAGPYFIKEEDAEKFNLHTITWLLDQRDELDKYEGVRTGLRQWLTQLHSGNGRADQQLDRLLSIKEDKAITDLINDLATQDNKATAAAEDCLTLYTIKHQKTKEDKQ